MNKKEKLVVVCAFVVFGTLLYIASFAPPISKEDEARMNGFVVGLAVGMGR